MSRSRDRQHAGFTLIETMAVVIIIGILATLAVYGVRKYIQSAKSAEARNMILAIKGAEEAYRDETYVYLGASAAGFQSTGSLYPQVCAGGQAPARRKYAWEQTCAAANAWRELGVTSTNPVQYGYAVTAVQAGGEMPKVSVPGGSGEYDWGTRKVAAGPAYAVIANGDLDGNGIMSLFVGSNYTDEIYVENEDE